MKKIPEQQSHGRIRKSKAFGTIGILAVTGLALLTNQTTTHADEVTTEPVIESSSADYEEIPSDTVETTATEDVKETTPLEETQPKEETTPLEEIKPLGTSAFRSVGDNVPRADTQASAITSETVTTRQNAEGENIFEFDISFKDNVPLAGTSLTYTVGNVSGLLSLPQDVRMEDGTVVGQVTYEEVTNADMKARLDTIRGTGKAPNGSAIPNIANLKQVVTETLKTGTLSDVTVNITLNDTIDQFQLSRRLTLQPQFANPTPSVWYAIDRKHDEAFKIPLRTSVKNAQGNTLATGKSAVRFQIMGTPNTQNLTVYPENDNRLTATLSTTDKLVVRRDNSNANNKPNSVSYISDNAILTLLPQRPEDYRVTDPWRALVSAERMSNPLVNAGSTFTLSMKDNIRKLDPNRNANIQFVNVHQGTTTTVNTTNLITSDGVIVNPELPPHKNTETPIGADTVTVLTNTENELTVKFTKDIGFKDASSVLKALIYFKDDGKVFKDQTETAALTDMAATLHSIGRATFTRSTTGHTQELPLNALRVMNNVKMTGTRNKPSEVTKEPIAFTESFIADPSLEKGQKKVDTLGVAGEKTITTSYTYDKTTGQVQSSKKEERTKEPVNQVTKVGTKPLVEVSEIGFTETFEFDTAKPYGEKTIKIQGVKGTTTKTTTYKVNPQNGEVTADTPTSVSKEPVNQVTVVGTAPKVEKEVLTFDTTFIADETLAYKEQVVKIEGQAGLLTTVTTYTGNAQTGELSANEPTVTKDLPTTKVVRVGTKPKVNIEDLIFDTVYKPNDKEKVGVDKVEIKGVDGNITTTTTYTVDARTGEITANEPTSITTNPNTEVILKGTKPRIVVRIKEFTNKFVPNEEMDAGTSKLLIEGVDGNIRTTTTYTVNEKTGEVTANQPVVVDTPAITKVTEVGTKPIVDITLRPYDTIYIQDDTVPYLQGKLLTKGIKGHETTTTTFSVDPKTGELIPTVTVTSAEPITEIIAINQKEDEHVIIDDFEVYKRPTTPVEPTPIVSKPVETPNQKTLPKTSTDTQPELLGLSGLLLTGSLIGASQLKRKREN